MSNDSGQHTIWIEDMQVGMSRSLEKIVTERDIDLFAEVSLDRNPVHLDEDYARQSIFGGRVAHGMLSASLISAVVGGQLPGHGAIYMGQNLRFLHPVRPGDRVLVEVIVQAIENPDSGSMKFATAQPPPVSA